MNEPTDKDRAGPTLPGIPPGLVGPVVSILGAAKGPVRRRQLLEELGRRGHRVSLAGVNRVLQQLKEMGRTVETPDGIRLRD